MRATIVALVALFAGCASGSETGVGDTSTTPHGGNGGSGGGGSGLPLGADCNADPECASQLCREVFLDLPNKVCVSECASADDCPGEPFFCEALSPGDSAGYCIPHSPAHCLSCGEDADCGYLSEVCLVGPGDSESACHVDCALGGDAACPDEYTCDDVEVDGETRKLCMPDVPLCADALGGFCDRIDMPLPCGRTSEAGLCTGQRECFQPSGRYRECDAAVPECKADCDAENPPGCMVSFCDGATFTPEDCGSCGNACPGVGAPDANIACLRDASCTFSCQGEHYDVDDDPETGCEVVDSPLDNHVEANASDLGSFPCTDGDSNPDIAGTLHSDARAHEMAGVNGFDATTGSAPDWYRLFADVGVCENEVVLTLIINGVGSNLDCYQLYVYTDEGTYSCTTSTTGSCFINQDGTGLYSDDSDIRIAVSKTCDTTVTESVTYTVTGHL
jgi:hypothetical protein